MIHTIDKKYLEDRIAELEVELKNFGKNKDDNGFALLVFDAAKILSVKSELQQILSKIEELEVANGKVLEDDYLYNHDRLKSFSEYLIDNNYLIVKNPNK